MHIMNCHVLEYMALTGNTLKQSSDEMVESSHQLVRDREQRYGCKMTKDLTSARKLKRCAKFIARQNSLNKKFKPN